MKESTEEIKLLSEYEIAIRIFVVILVSSNSRSMDQFSKRGRHINLDISYLSQSDFGLPNRSIINKSIKTILFIQALKKTYRYIGGYDMSYDDFEEKSRKPWEQEYKNLCIDRSKKRDQERYCSCIESKNTYTICIPETKPFWLT